MTVNHAAIENGWQLAAGTPPLTIGCRRNSINFNTVRSGAGPVDHAALPVLLEGDLHTMSAQIVERRFCSDQNLAVEHYWRRLQLLDAADDSAPNEVLRDAFYGATTADEQQRRRRENETVAGLQAWRLRWSARGAAFLRRGRARHHHHGVMSPTGWRRASEYIRD